jgi:hypothetical protein
MHKSHSSDQIPAELNKAGSGNICFAIHKLVKSIWNKEELPDQWKESIVVPVYKKGDKQSVVTIVACHSCQLHTKIYQTSFYQG